MFKNRTIQKEIAAFPRQIFDIIRLFEPKIKLTQGTVDKCKQIARLIGEHQKQNPIGKLPENGVFSDMEESLLIDQEKLQQIIKNL